MNINYFITIKMYIIVLKFKFTIQRNNFSFSQKDHEKI